MIVQFPNGLTVKELKELIKDWPETDNIGDPTEVWVEHNGFSNQVKSVSPLNAREDDETGHKWSDILFDTGL
jgi:hypothetical protein